VHVPSSAWLRRRQTIRNHVENRRRIGWPDTAPDGTVTAVSVNYNTLEVTLQMIYSLHRVLAEPPARIVVVDNGSSDGSVAFLRHLHRAGLITLVRNRLSSQHGPGLNRGIAKARRITPDASLLWVLDSDVFMVRPDAMSAAIAFLGEHNLATCGPEQHGDRSGIPDGYAHVSCLLFDPRLVWRRPTPVFFHHGAPGATMQRYLRRIGVRMDFFPFYDQSYVVHIGKATLHQVVADGRTSNPYYGWARDRPGRDYTGNADGPALHEALSVALHKDMPVLDPQLFAAACQIPDRIDLVGRAQSL